MKILCCCPCATNMINVDTVDSIDSLGITRQFICGSLVYDAREKFVKEAIENNYDYILFVDSDMIFEKEELQTLYNIARKGNDVVTGLYFARKGTHKPIIYKNLYVDEDMICHKEEYTEEEFDELLKQKVQTVGGCGMGFCLIKVNICKEMLERFGSCFMPVGNFGEDLSFCWKVNLMGKKIKCAMNTKIGHIGDAIYTINDYWKNCKKVVDK